VQSLLANSFKFKIAVEVNFQFILNKKNEYIEFQKLTIFYFFFFTYEIKIQSLKKSILFDNWNFINWLNHSINFTHKIDFTSECCFLGSMVLTHQKMCSPRSKSFIKKYFEFWGTRIIVFLKAEFVLKKLSLTHQNFTKNFIKNVSKTCQIESFWCVLDILKCALTHFLKV
jgi:hypothetical protein